MVVVARHPIFSLLFLVVSFLFAALLLFFVECEFLALVFIVVYVGAIAILFLFAIMMLESKLSNLLKNSMKYFSVGILFSFFLLIPLLYQISLHFISNFSFYFFNFYPNWYALIDCINDIEAYGQVLYSFFVFQFLISGLIILLILICVTYLTNNIFISQIKNQSLFKQLSRTYKFF